MILTLELSRYPDVYFLSKRITLNYFRQVSISDESIGLESTINASSSAKDDFEGSLLSSMQDSVSSLVVFCAEDRVAGQPSKWTLIAWVPDNSKVRDKMLYSSSREDLKKALGLGYFSGEYYANAMEDLTWEQFTDYISKDRSDGPLSMKEQLILEEKVGNIGSIKTKSKCKLCAIPSNFPQSYVTCLLVSGPYAC